MYISSSDAVLSLLESVNGFIRPLSGTEQGQRSPHDPSPSEAAGQTENGCGTCSDDVTAINGDSGADVTITQSDPRFVP